MPNCRGSVDSLTIWGLGASNTLLLRCCYDPTTIINIWLRLVYADGDLAATLLRHWRWSYAFVALFFLLYPSYIESEIPIRFYYDLGASTVLKRVAFGSKDCTYYPQWTNCRFGRHLELQWSNAVTVMAFNVQWSADVKSIFEILKTFMNALADERLFLHFNA